MAGSLENNDLNGGISLCLGFPSYRMLKTHLRYIGLL